MKLPNWRNQSRIITLTAPRLKPRELIRKKKITFSVGDYGDAFDGLIEHKSGKFHIYCNRARLHHESRVRFTLGHELGRFFIPEHRNALEAGVGSHPSFSEYQSDDPAEQEADLFASNLLMPSLRFTKAASRYGQGLAAILPLASEFSTSWTSTAIRYIKLNLIPGVIVMWRTDGRTWHSFSRSLFDAGIRKLNLTHENIPNDSPTGRVFRAEAAPECGYFEGTTLASQWFPFIRQGDSRDVFVTEQAIRVGNYGFLTVIIMGR